MGRKIVFMYNIEISFKTRICRYAASCVAFVFLSICASQCFAESSSKSSKDTYTKSRQYMEMMAGFFDYLQRNYVDEVDPEILYKGALKGMLESLNDPYTVYLDNSGYRNLSDTTEGQFGGVGLSISKPVESTSDKPAYVEVASPIDDTPGAKAGILAGDLIISVDGTDTSTISMEEVLDKLRGKVGESVEVVIRRGSNMEFPVTLVRALIEVPTVKFGKIGDVGYIHIIEFTPLTPDRVQQAIDQFKSEKIKGLIIDLRNNPGGLITSVADVADKFIDKGPIVSTKSRLMFENSVFTASSLKTTFPKGIPIIVLINKGSASASEILSGALKDNHLAYLVGQRTYGKGSVQQVRQLSETDGFKITMARYYTPSDTNIDKIGIPPDREVLFPELGEEGEKQYMELIKSRVVEEYTKVHTDMSEGEIASYAEELSKKYDKIDLRSLRKYVRNWATRTKGSMLYDLDFDIQLNEALSILASEDFNELVSNTKTLKELQTEAEQNLEKSKTDKSVK